MRHKLSIAYSIISWLLTNVKRYSPVYFILGTFFGVVSKGLTILSMVASLRGLVYLFRFDPKAQINIPYSSGASISSSEFVFIIAATIFLLYLCTAFSNYISFLLLEKCNQQLYENDQAFNKIEIMEHYTEKNDKKNFIKASRFFLDRLPGVIYDLSRLIHLTLILFLIFLAIGIINYIFVILILSAAVGISLIVLRNSAKDLFYMDEISKQGRVVSTEKEDKLKDMSFNRQDIIEYKNSDSIRLYLKNKSSFRMQTPKIEFIFMISYGFILVLVFVMFLLFDLKNQKLDPIVILILVFSLRYGIAYARQIGQCLARILRIRTELKLLNINVEN